MTLHLRDKNIYQKGYVIVNLYDVTIAILSLCVVIVDGDEVSYGSYQDLDVSQHSTLYML